LILSAALLMLAMHSSVQLELHREVEAVSSELGDTITEKHLHKLSYCEMVVKEAMRLFPVLPIHARIANEDVKLEKYTIPKGANIVISVFNAHRKVENWGHDADKFKPERFLSVNLEKIHPYAFLPWSRGDIQFKANV
jgi:cytochrome P450